MTNREKNVGLKISVNPVPVDLIKIIMKYRGDSIVSIKESIENNEYVLSCYYSGDKDNFDKIIQCYTELTKAGYSPELYEHNRKSSIEFFKNWSNTMADIRRETNEETDEEVGESENIIGEEYVK